MVKKVWSPILDTGRCMIDFKVLTIDRWEYLLYIMDFRVTLKFKEYFSTHLFAIFIDLVVIEASVQVVTLVVST